MFRVEAICMCSRGKVRPRNEDNFLFNGVIRTVDPDDVIELYEKNLPCIGQALCVFDGMGGMSNGDDASLCAAKFFSEHPVISDSYEEQITSLCAKANLEVCRIGEILSVDTGTTIAMMSFSRDMMIACNVGDSRIYSLRDNQLVQISKDHSDEDILRASGNSTRRPRLLQYLGMPGHRKVFPTIRTEKIRRNDLFLCCTDGVCSMLSDGEIEDVLKGSESLTEKAHDLMQHVFENGGCDNITFIICRVRIGI